MVCTDAALSVALLQLSDLHLLADPLASYRGAVPARAFDRALDQALRQCPQSPQWLLLSGDLAQDESWLAYAHLRRRLEKLSIQLAVLPGNHDHPQLLRSCLGRQACIAPALVPLGEWQLLLLDSHRPGQTRGWLGQSQLRWAEQVLKNCRQPVLIAVHHPIDHFQSGDSAWLARLSSLADLKVLLVGHIHQHRQDLVGGAVQLACPSTLVQFEAQQPCPLMRSTWPGGRFVELGADGHWRDTLLRWSP